jgi:ABC-type sugar transport system substrate-binding protein
VSIRPRPHARALSGLTLGVAALLLAACGATPTDPGTDTVATLPKTLVFSPLSLAPPALKGLAEGVKGYAGSQGWEVIVQDPNFDAAKQVQQLNEVLQSGRAGAAWVLAVAPQSMAGTIKIAQENGIPLLINGKPGEYGFMGPLRGISFDYIDYSTSGSALGEQLGTCVNQKLGGSAKVLWLQSTEGTAGKEQFESSTKSALTAVAPNATVVQTIIVKERAQAQTDVGNALQGHPEINAVMATNDEGALGALGAFAAAGKKITCLAEFGGNDEVLGLVKDGKIFASVALQFDADMAQSFDTLVKLQANPKAYGQVLVVPQKIIKAG